MWRWILPNTLLAAMLLFEGWLANNCDYRSNLEYAFSVLMQFTAGVLAIMVSTTLLAALGVLK